ncbi:MAG: hypothetical protein V4722_11840 [Bacteroidota bacterium]
MNTTYKILNAITLNVTGNKYNAVAAECSKAELLKHKSYFGFDFVKLIPAFTVYKLHLEDEPNIIQGLFSFRISTGFLQCENMEINKMNKHGKAIYSGVGKLMIALCCKISHDLGFGGYISFLAKNRLFNYYRRFGAQRIGDSNTMFIDESTAQKIIAKHF